MVRHRVITRRTSTTIPKVRTGTIDTTRAKPRGGTTAATSRRAWSRHSCRIPARTGTWWIRIIASCKIARRNSSRRPERSGLRPSPHKSRARRRRLPAARGLLLRTSNHRTPNHPVGAVSTSFECGPYAFECGPYAFVTARRRCARARGVTDRSRRRTSHAHAIRTRVRGPGTRVPGARARTRRSRSNNDTTGVQPHELAA